MKLNIELYNEKSFLCYEIGIATVAKWYHRKFEMMFLDSWDFTLVRANSSGERIGNLINTENWNIEANLNHYHGIKIVEKLYQITDQAFLDFINNEICSNRPVFVNREFLIVGIEHRDIYRFDILKNRLDFGPLRSLIPNVRNYISFEITDNELLDINLQDIMHHTLERIGPDINQKKSMFNQIREFAEIFYVAFDSKVEQGNIKNVNDIPIIEKILDLSRSRKLFSMALYYAEQVNHINYFNEIMVKLEQASDKWLLIMGLLEKFFYSSNFQDSAKIKIYKYIKEVADFEMEIYRMFTSLLSTIDSKLTLVN